MGISLFRTIQKHSLQNVSDIVKKMPIILFHKAVAIT